MTTDFSEPGADQQSLGAEHLHLQPENIPSHRRTLQTGRTLDRQDSESLLQVKIEIEEKKVY